MISFRTSERMGGWQWAVSLMLLAATMINYMDRQTLANLAPRITKQFELSDQQYGNLEQVFALSFATGSLLWGVLADAVPVRILYPVVLLAWSIVGFVTGLTHDYTSLFYCRGALGFFESGHWPCALVVTHSILTSANRPLANSILQSGASLGAIVTPLIIFSMVVGRTGPDAWRPPFLIIGSIGLLWVCAWFWIVRKDSVLNRLASSNANTPPVPDPNSAETSSNPAQSSAFEDSDGSNPYAPISTKSSQNPRSSLLSVVVSPKFWAMVFMVVSINIAWQMIRAWLPKFLQEGRGYSEAASLLFNSAYYLATDIGCIAAGAAALVLARQGWSAHTSRIIVYACCALLASLTVVAALLPASPLFLVLLLIVGAGTLGLFPCYYSFTQELDASRVGKVTGMLSFLGWMLSAPVHPYFGSIVDKTKSYDMGVACVGLVPLVGLVAILVLWPKQADAAHA